MRVLELGGGHNFRDMGGYRAANGRTVKWRTLFRSGQMSSIDQDGARLLRDMRIVSICDFRTSGERQRHPTVWHDEKSTRMYWHDYGHSAGMLKLIAGKGCDDQDGVRQIMLDAYSHFPEEQAENYAALFRRLAEGMVPIVFNCAAGKDRTGAGAALVLKILGVSHDDIVADYLLTNEWFEELAMMLAESGEFREILADRPEVVRPLIRAESAYLEHFLDRLDAEYGGPEGYVRERLGISAGEIAAIRAVLTD